MYYCTPNDVALALGLTLEAGQESVALDLCGAATAWIDRYTGRSWQSPTVTDEMHRVIGENVWLKQVPVVSVASATLQAPGITATSKTLVANTDYRLIDAENGWLRVDGAFADVLKVSYTAASGVPHSVKEAAIALVGAALGPTLAPDALGGAIQRVSLAGGDLSVTYANWRETGLVPPAVTGWLMPYRRMAVVVG